MATSLPSTFPSSQQPQPLQLPLLPPEAVGAVAGCGAHHLPLPQQEPQQLAAAQLLGSGRCGVMGMDWLRCPTFVWTHWRQARRMPSLQLRAARFATAWRGKGRDMSSAHSVCS